MDQQNPSFLSILWLLKGILNSFKDFIQINSVSENKNENFFETGN